MQNIKIDKKILFIFAIYLYPIMLKNLAVPCYFYIYGIPTLYMFINHKILSSYIAKIKIKQQLCFLGSLVIIFSSICVPIIYGTFDFTYIKTSTYIFRRMYIYIFLCCVLMKRYKGKNIINLFMYYFCFTTSIYVLGSIVFCFLPDLKSFWTSMLASEEIINSVGSSFGYSLRFGWQGFAGYRMTLNCCISIAFIIYLFFDKNSTVKMSEKTFSILFFGSFLGNMFYGRSGIIFSVICVITATILYHKLNWKIVIGSIGVLILGVLIISNFQDTTGGLHDWYVWMSTPFRNFLKTGEFNNYSFDRLFEQMIFMPSPSTFLIGDGYYTNPTGSGYYMHTDSGFMRQILFWGIGMTFFTYFITIKSINSLGRHYKILIFLLLIIFAGFEIKGEVYYEFISLVLAISVLQNPKKIYKGEQ